jgi:preprotein translocase subunit SecY
VGKTTGRGGGGSAGGPSGGGGGGDLGDALATSLPLKLAALVGLVALSRVGVFLRLPGVDADAFASSLASGGLLGYIDTLSGGSISRVGVFSLGIVPYINASIVLQLMSTAFPSLKKLQREEGPQGRVRFQFYQKCLALVFAVVQAFGQLSYVRPFVPDWSTEWLGSSVLSLTAGAMILIWIADLISELKVGNGTSILITANIASSLPTSVGAALAQAGAEGGGGPAALAAYGAAFIATTLGVVYVQEAERQIPINYASRYRARSASLQRAAYLPFKVNATGVMPVIFASTLLSLPAGLARYAPSLEGVAKAVGPAGPLYLPVRLLFSFFAFSKARPLESLGGLSSMAASAALSRPPRPVPAVGPARARFFGARAPAFVSSIRSRPATPSRTHFTKKENTQLFSISHQKKIKTFTRSPSR